MASLLFPKFRHTKYARNGGFVLGGSGDDGLQGQYNPLYWLAYLDTRWLVPLNMWDMISAADEASEELEMRKDQFEQI